MVISAGEIAEPLQLRDMAEQMGLQGQEAVAIARENSKKLRAKNAAFNVKEHNIIVKKGSDNEKQMMELEKKHNKIVNKLLDNVRPRLQQECTN